MSIRLVLAIAIVALLASACGGAPAPTVTPAPTSTWLPTRTPTDTPAAIATDTPSATETTMPTPTDTPTPIATLMLTSTPIVSPTAIATGTPLAMVTATPTPAATIPPGPMPDPTVVQTGAAHQLFENGFMIWLESRDAIWAAVCCTGTSPREGHWVAITDDFEVGMPESDPSIVAPPGLLQPIRGFGLAWRTASGPAEEPLRELLGWAVEEEVGYTGRLEHWPGLWRVDAPGGVTYCFYEAGPAWSVCPATVPP